MAAWFTKYLNADNKSQLYKVIYLFSQLLRSQFTTGKLKFDLQFSLQMLQSPTYRSTIIYSYCKTYFCLRFRPVISDSVNFLGKTSNVPLGKQE